MNMYIMPKTLNKPYNQYDKAANIGLFLSEQGQKTYGYWSGKMKAEDQRKLFGTYLGKGNIHVDGLEETVTHTVKVCFGTDFTETAILNFKKGEEIYNR